mmetsp:Transcript_47974/g.71073  ORF Transcript_47974/g.71073 Transcript_47974/m.71073 type:complete len:344 (-) Transcript_47974:113-1144(-)|eukprot:CAMPEP_0195507222 /NCGR_PEP_ID=MMETSP0794_2-20130614/712_1 /TAXON_ID=515487 /ORGANISM="Stephanopyxis turris, Strain CCMP 815" /LENGTH=343 /DNA_ID=CAMNT_0040633831 /DNA_START=169 /DNA_END=1200 /DNA_ORIENTATION=-
MTNALFYLAFLTASLSKLLLIQGMPMTYLIPHKVNECLYEKLEAGEFVTMSVFISGGSDLKGTVTLEGPVAHPYAETAAEINKFIQLYEGGKRFGKEIAKETGQEKPDPRNRNKLDLMIREAVDFEEIADLGLDMDDFYDDDDDIMIYADDDELPEEERARRQDMIDERKKEKKEMMQKHKNMGDKRLRDGSPWKKTVEVDVAGWYRGCLKATWFEINAEMELRKSSELGSPDKTSGHIMTYEHRAMLDNERLGKTPPKDAATKDDLKVAGDMVRKLSRHLEQIKRKQSIERHEISVHSKINEHSRSRMVLGSLLETVLFIAVTGFQVYSIRKWFEGPAMLGR